MFELTPRDPHDYFIFIVFLSSDDFQPLLAMKFFVESEFQGQGPPKPPETPEPPVPPEPPEWVLVLVVPV